MGEEMAAKTARKRNRIIAWLMFIIGFVITCDGIYQLTKGSGDRLGEASVGGLLMILSVVFFVVSRNRETEK